MYGLCREWKVLVRRAPHDIAATGQAGDTLPVRSAQASAAQAHGSHPSYGAVVAGRLPSSGIQALPVTVTGNVKWLAGFAEPVRANCWLAP